MTMLPLACSALKDITVLAGALPRFCATLANKTCNLAKVMYRPVRTAAAVFTTRIPAESVCHALLVMCVLTRALRRSRAHRESFHNSNKMIVRPATPEHTALSGQRRVFRASLERTLRLMQLSAIPAVPGGSVRRPLRRQCVLVARIALAGKSVVLHVLRENSVRKRLQNAS